MRIRRAIRQAFTLVELLVVIGIIAVLVGVLLPVIRNAREQAVSLQCLSNLRACGQLIYIYANQNKGMLPPTNNQTVDKFPKGDTFIMAGSTGTGQVSTGVLYPNLRYALDRIANPGRKGWIAYEPYDAGNMQVFYCPANYLWDGQARASQDAAGNNSNSHFPEDFMVDGNFRYWYLGNPNPQYPRYHYTGIFPVQNNTQAGIANTVDWRWWDRNGSGDNRDDYMVKVGDKNVANICIMTDQSRQETSTSAAQFGHAFIHGRKGTGRITGWKNNLYGDGHAESRRPNARNFTADGTAFDYTKVGKLAADELQPGYGPIQSGGTGTMLW